MKLSQRLAMAAGGGADVVPPEYVSYVAKLSNLLGGTIDTPSGVQNGDRLFFFIKKSASATITIPGWTQVFTKDSGVIACYTKVANSEGSSISFSLSSYQADPRAVVMCFRGVGGYSAVEGSGFNNIVSGSTSESSSLYVDVFFTGADSSSAFFSSMSNGDLTAYAKKFDVSSTSGDGGGWAAGMGVKEAAGVVSATNATGVSTNFRHSVLILEP